MLLGGCGLELGAGARARAAWLDVSVDTKAIQNGTCRVGVWTGWWAERGAEAKALGFQGAGIQVSICITCFSFNPVFFPVGSDLPISAFAHRGWSWRTYPLGVPGVWWGVGRAAWLSQRLLWLIQVVEPPCLETGLTRPLPTSRPRVRWGLGAGGVRAVAAGGFSPPVWPLSPVPLSPWLHTWLGTAFWVCRWISGHPRPP